MRQTELHLTDEDSELVASYRAKGLRHAREVNRAHVLSALDRGIPEAQIMAVHGVGRTVIWRTRAAYREGGVACALRDAARPGKPRLYDTDVEAQISALACSTPPTGAKRWTIALLEQAASPRAQPETVIKWHRESSFRQFTTASPAPPQTLKSQLTPPPPPPPPPRPIPPPSPTASPP
jgi:transposase